LPRSVSAVPDRRLKKFQLLFGRLVPELTLNIEETAAAKAIQVIAGDKFLFFIGKRDAAALALCDIADFAFKGRLTAPAGF